MPETQRVAEVVEIPVQNVHPNPNNPRDEIPGEDASIAQLAGEIETMGQLVPCLVYPRPDGSGEYELWDGYRRRLAVLHAGLPTLRCIVVEKSNRAELEQLEVMLSTGRNHRQLSALEEAKGFQQMLALGLNESTIGKKFKQPKRAVLAKAAVLQQPESVQARYNAGQLDIDGLIKLQRLADTRPEVAERVHEVVSRFPHQAEDMDRLIARQKLEEAQATKGAELEAAGAKTDWQMRNAEYYGWEPVPHPEDGDHLTIAQHVTAGHQYSIEPPADVDGDAEVRWYRKPKRDQADKPEMSDDERSQKAMFRRLNQHLPVSADARHRHVIERIVDPRGLDMATDNAMLMELIDAHVIGYPNEALLADVTGIPMPIGEAGTDGYDRELWSRKQEWTDKVRARLATWSWGSLIRLWIYTRHRAEDRKLAKAPAWDPTLGDTDNRVRWMNRVQTDFEYRLDEHEAELVHYFQAKQADHIERNPERYRVKVQR